MPYGPRLTLKFDSAIKSTAPWRLPLHLPLRNSTEADYINCLLASKRLYLVAPSNRSFVLAVHINERTVIFDKVYLECLNSVSRTIRYYRHDQNFVRAPVRNEAGCVGAIPFATVEGSYVVAQFSLASYRSGYCHGNQS